MTTREPLSDAARSSSEQSDERTSRAHRVRHLAHWIRSAGDGLTGFQQRAVEVLLLLCTTAFLLWFTRRMWFFSDDWAFLLGRREVLHSRGVADYLFLPHNEHLLAGIALVYSVLMPVFGMESAVSFMVVLLIGHALVCWMVARLAVRIGVSWGWSLLAMVWLAVFGAGNENLIWPVEIGYVWGTVAALAALLLVTGRASLRRDVAASSVFLVGLMMGPTGLYVLVLVAVWLLATQQWRRLVIVVPAPAVFYAWWYLAYGRRFSPPWGHPKSVIVPYFVRGVTNALDKTLILPGVGTVLWLGALVVLARAANAPAARRIVVMCTVAFLGFFVLGGLARGGLGPEQSTSPRYVYVAGVFVVPVLVAAASECARRYPFTRWVIAGLAVLAVAGNLSLLAEGRRARADVLAELRPSIEIAAMHARSPIVEPGFQPEPKYNPDITMSRLAEILNSGIWSPAPVLTAEQWLEGSLDFGIVVRGDGPTAASNNVGLTLVGSEGSVRPVADGCLEIKVAAGTPALLRLQHDAPGGFVAVTGDGTVELSATLVDDGGTESGVRSLASLGQEPVWVGVDPVYGEPRLLFSGTGAATVCGVQLRR